MSEMKNAYPNLLLAASWRDVMRMVGSKASHDLHKTVAPVTARTVTSAGNWLVKVGTKLHTTRK